MRNFVLPVVFLTSLLLWRCEAFAVQDAPTNPQKNAISTEISDAQAFQEALKGTRAPWLDPDATSVKYLPQERPKEWKDPRFDKLSSFPSKKFDNSSLSGAALFARILFWTLGAIAFIAVAVILIRYARTIWKNRENARKWNEAVDRERRLETLAPEARARFDDLLEAAKDALARRNYRDALIFYFSWILVELDKREFVFLDRGKTNMEYLRELRDVEPLFSIYRATMREFERAYYGGRPISGEEFDAVWNLRESFESTLRAKDAALTEAESNKAKASGVARVLLIGALVPGALLPGCSRREKTWSERYSEPAAIQFTRDRSLNGIGAFQNYCRSKFGSITTPGRAFNGDKTSTIVVFQSGLGYWRSHRLDCDPWYSDKTDPEKRLETLRKFADSTEDDWNRLARPTALYVCSDEIEEWLKAKDGRTFVWVLPGHSYELEYWKAARKRLEREAPYYLEECDEQIKNLEKIEISSKLSLTYELEELRKKARKLLAEEQADSQKEDETTSESSEGDPTDAAEESANFDIPLFDESTYESDFRDAMLDWDVDGEANQGVYSSQYFVAFGTSAIEPRVEPFSGDESWTKDLPKEGLSTETRRLETQDSLETLLALGDCALVQRLPVGNSQVLVVNSTSFLSNYGLMDPTNQKIAARLTDEFDKDGKIAFCYGYFWGFSNEESDVWDVERSEFSLTKISPFTIFIWHVVALTTLVFFYFFPIMGRAKRMRRERIEDFGLHIDATARLLKGSGSVDWVREHLDAFRASNRPNEK